MNQESDASGPRIITPEGIVSHELVLPSEVLPINLHLLPVHDRPFFPVHAMPVMIDQARWASTVARVGKAPNRAVGLVLVTDEADELPTPD